MRRYPHQAGAILLTILLVLGCRHDITWYLLQDPDRRLEREPDIEVRADGRHDIVLHVYDSDGRPTGSLEVIISKTRPDAMGYAWTDHEGHIKFSDRKPGRYRYEFGCGATYLGSNVVDLAPGTSVTVRFYLNRSWAEKLPCQIEPPPDCKHLGEVCRWGEGSSSPEDGAAAR